MNKQCRRDKKPIPRNEETLDLLQAAITNCHWLRSPICIPHFLREVGYFISLIECLLGTPEVVACSNVALKLF